MRPAALAAPGRIPAYLPAFAADNAEVARLKGKYNAAIGQLHASAQAISAAVSARSADAQAAAQMIRTATGGDGLNNRRVPCTESSTPPMTPATPSPPAGPGSWPAWPMPPG